MVVAEPVKREIRSPIAARPVAAAFLLLISSIACFANPDLAPAAPVSASPAAAEATTIGQASCRACHVTEADHWATTVHARLPQRPRNELEKLGCEGCHGPGSEHAKAPSERGRIVSFTRQSASSVETLNGMCLSCHAGGTRIYWSGSAHERQGLACSDCHDPMSEQSPRGLLAKQGVSQTCFSCHPEQRAQFRKRSHMPLPEGKIACSDCHAPHGSATEPLLRADSVNQLCYQCHAEKRGPFLWEHAPVVENCLTCHQPHGSNHEGLLVSPAPFLCNQCHDQPGAFGHPNDLLTRGNLASGTFPDSRILNRGCVNCHVQIHGSNHPSGARFHR